MRDSAQSLLPSEFHVGRGVVHLVNTMQWHQIRDTGTGLHLQLAVQNCLVWCSVVPFPLQANDAYLQMAIGNAPWPIGVTMVGIHARTGREKIFSKHVAHVLNDETQRKYIQVMAALEIQQVCLSQGVFEKRQCHGNIRWCGIRSQKWTGLVCVKQNIQWTGAHPGPGGSSVLGQEQSHGFFWTAVILHEHQSSCEDRLDSPEASHCLTRALNMHRI